MAERNAEITTKIILPNKKIDAIIHSLFYRHIGSPFLLRYGTWESKLYALAYLLSPVFYVTGFYKTRAKMKDGFM